MRRLFVLMAAAAAIFFNGCGGSGGITPSPTPEPAPISTVSVPVGPAGTTASVGNGFSLSVPAGSVSQ